MVRVPLAVLGLCGGLSIAFVAWPAVSASTPQLKLSAVNNVPACVAPARLMQHVAKLNPRVDPKFREVAALYQTHGQSLGLRWDYAFFQMLAETGNLSFAGDVTKDHNNFAGIRTADGNEPDRFADVSTGVQAHLHHIRLYAGDPVAKPAAKRTKQVENFILSWSRQLKRPVRFDDMIGRWSPNNPGYARTIETSLKDYQVAHCAGEVAALAASDDAAPSSDETPAAGRRAGKSSQAAAKPAPAAERAPAFDPPAATVSEPVRTASAQAPAKLGMPIGSQVALGQAAGGSATAPAAPAQPASAAAAGASALAPPASGAQCKVWSASFGGDKSVLIRVNDGQLTHFTALQVNAGREKEETTAYIAAYARGGRTVGEFTSADQAINKAFELCPKT
jgi:Mannosyl-glycoprotein endo-beta-N-acetylglucosaminidase